MDRRTHTLVDQLEAAFDEFLSDQVAAEAEADWANMTAAERAAWIAAFREEAFEEDIEVEA
jgi:hypothetical protein